MLNGKATIAKFSNFLKPKSFGVKVKVETDLFNCATKEDLKYATGVDTSNFAKKVNLASLNLKLIN